MFSNEMMTQTANYKICSFGNQEEYLQAPVGVEPTCGRPQLTN